MKTRKTSAAFKATRGWLGRAVLVGAMALAGCGVDDEDQPIDGTDVGTVPTIPATLGPVATGVGTEAPVITPDPQATPLATGPLVVQASRLIGTEIVDQNGVQVGEVSDLFLAADGRLRYAGVDMGLDTGEGMIAVDWSALQPHPPVVLESQAEGEAVLPDDALIFLGVRANLEQAPLWTPEAGEAAILRTESAELPAPLNDLLRVSGAATDFNLLNSAGEDLGEVEDVLLDLQTAQAVYGLAELGGFLGLAEHTVAVPWEQFGLQGGAGDETPQLVLDVPTEALADAPVFAPETLPEFPAPTVEDWDAEHREFWDDVGA